MSSPRYGYDHWEWTRRREIPKISEADYYFIYIEEAAPVSMNSLIRPDGKPLEKESLSGENLWRFRASGLETHRFLQVMERFEPLDHDSITDNQRSRRRALLVDAFGNMPLPLLDLYVSRNDENLPFLRAALTPASWYWIAVVQRVEDDPRLPIFVGAPELAAGPYLPGSLELIDSVPPYIEYRLRDIFSLAHVPDAGFEAIGGEPSPTPDKPHDENHEVKITVRHWKSRFGEGTPPHEMDA